METITTTKKAKFLKPRIRSVPVKKTRVVAVMDVVIATKKTDVKSRLLINAAVVFEIFQVFYYVQTNSGIEEMLICCCSYFEETACGGPVSVCLQSTYSLFIIGKKYVRACEAMG